MYASLEYSDIPLDEFYSLRYWYGAINNEERRCALCQVGSSG